MVAALKKTAVILLNLGGPQREEDIQPFLYNFFMDRNIIDLPQPLRWAVARQISYTRSRGAARQAYSHLDFRSPLVDNTRKQAAALEKLLNDQGHAAKVFVSMRYWHPTARDIIPAVGDYAPDNLVLLPLYPQYSTTTTKSSFADFWAQVQEDDGKLHARWDDETKPAAVCCYPVMQGFITASADRIREKLKTAPKGTRLLLSAHGLPEKIIRKGDPYQAHCELTAKAIVAALDIDGLDWQLCYQSRVGRLKWIGPSVDEALEKAARDNVGVVVYPHAFVSEHVETLVELDIEYRHRARDLGIAYFDRAETVGTHPDFIAGLAKLVVDKTSGISERRNCPCNGMNALYCLPSTRTGKYA